MTSHANGAWALILGASSGFGGATAVELARAGMHVFGVHLDRSTTIANVERVVADIQAQGREAVFFNINAADAGKRANAADAMRSRLSDGASIRVVLHSLAFGTLRDYVPPNPEVAVTQRQMDMTLDVMAHSLVYWVQDLVYRKLLAEGSRIFAMTSAGSTRIWPSYGPVSAAKAALESHIRQLAYELAPRGIAVNAVRAGVTDTPALRKIPGNAELLAGAQARNPSRRLTTPEDVARAIAALSNEGAYWMTGNTLGVDGGEDLVG